MARRVRVFAPWWLGLLCLGRAMWQKEHVADKVLYFMVDRAYRKDWGPVIAFKGMPLATLQLPSFLILFLKFPGLPKIVPLAGDQVSSQHTHPNHKT